MKIISDKIKSGIQHSITKKDIQLILRIIPNDWVGVANVFHISSQFYEKNQWDRLVIGNGVVYKIHSRGLEKSEIVKGLLIAIAESPAGVYNTRAHSLRKNDKKKIEEVIKPFFEVILEKINN